jgi:hypothetical protein
MSGGGVAADATGNLYFATGNGTWNGTTDFGDSIVKLGPPANNTFPVVDYFTHYNQASLASKDVDLGSGGLVVLPTLSSGQQLLAQQGKQGTIYRVDANNLGQYCVNLTPACNGGNDPQIVQEIQGQGASAGIWGSPAYWNGNLYWTGANDSIQAYSFNANGSGLLSTSPTSVSAQIFAFSAPTPTVSSNGTTNGILWALDGSAADSTCDGGGSDCLGLYAYDATNLGHLLYASSQAATKGGWDNDGFAYSASLLGTSITAGGSTFTIGTAGTTDAVSNTTIPLPAGNYATLNLLGSAVNGKQANQSFVVTYTDGTKTTITQSLSDWWGPPQNYPGESPVLQMAYLITPTGATLNHGVYLYGYTFAINSAMTVKSLTLPTNRNVVILAVDVI